MNKRSFEKTLLPLKPRSQKFYCVSAEMSCHAYVVSDYAGKTRFGFAEARKLQKNTPNSEIIEIA